MTLRYNQCVVLVEVLTRDMWRDTRHWFLIFCQNYVDSPRVLTFRQWLDTIAQTTPYE